MKEFTIGQNDAGQRLDRFLAKAVPLLPASLAQKYIRIKRVKCNGKRIDRDTRLQEGDVLQLYINDEFFDQPKEDNLFLSLWKPSLDIVYEDENLLFDKTLRHSAEELEKFDSIPAQKDWRRKLVMKALEDQGFDVKTLSAVSGRGGLLAPIRGGTYAVSDRLVRDCTVGVQGQHASNLGGIIAREIGDQLGIPSFIVDPVVVDELSDVARYAGHPLFHRTSIFHALNQKAVAKRYAKEHGRKYEDLNLIVCHMGGGCSIGAHVHGSVVDTQNALDGDGPFSPERSGSLPTGQLVSLCFSGKYTAGEVRKMLAGHGGLVAYTGSNDMRDLLKAAAEGDKEIAATVDAFHYQIGKEVGAMAAVMKGKVDQIILTGGIAYGQETVDAITDMVGWIAPITVYPGEDELLALAQGALRVLNGEEPARVY